MGGWGVAWGAGGVVVGCVRPVMDRPGGVRRCLDHFLAGAGRLGLVAARLRGVRWEGYRQTLADQLGRSAYPWRGRDYARRYPRRCRGLGGHAGTGGAVGLIVRPVAAGSRPLKDDRHIHGGVGIMLDDILAGVAAWARSEEHTSELQSLMRISYAV